MAVVEGPLQTLDAAAVQDQLLDAEVVLFGSWTAGTWHSWSGLDLAVIGVESDQAQENEVWDLAHTATQDVYVRRPNVQCRLPTQEDTLGRHVPADG